MSASLSVNHFAAYFRRDRLLALRMPVNVGGSRWQQEQQLWLQQQQLLREHGGVLSSGVMTLKIPGRTYPVSVHFLTDVLNMCDAASLPLCYQKESSAAAAVQRRYKSGLRLGTVKTDWGDQQQDPFAPGAEPASKQTATSAAAAAAASAAVALPQLPQLVAAVVRHIHLTGGPCSPTPTKAGRGPRGRNQRQQQQQQEKAKAVIVFCSGMGDVAAVCRALEELQLPLWVLPCHASLHPSQQQKVHKGDSC